MLYGDRSKCFIEFLLCHIDGIVFGLFQFNDAEGEWANLPKGPILHLLESFSIAFPILIVFLVDDDETVHVWSYAPTHFSGWVAEDPNTLIQRVSGSADPLNLGVIIFPENPWCICQTIDCTNDLYHLILWNVQGKRIDDAVLNCSLPMRSSLLAKSEYLYPMRTILAFAFTRSSSLRIIGELSVGGSSGVDIEGMGSQDFKDFFGHCFFYQFLVMWW